MAENNENNPVQLEINFKSTDMTAELTNCLIDLQLARDYAAKHDLPELKKAQVLAYTKKIKVNCKTMQDIMKADTAPVSAECDLNRPVSTFVFDPNKRCNARIVGSLKRYGVTTMAELVKLSRVDLAVIPHINYKALRAVNDYMLDNDISWQKTSTFALQELAIPKELSPTAMDVEDFIDRLDWRLENALSHNSQVNPIDREISNVRNRWNLAVNKFTVASLADKAVPAEKSLVFKSKVQTRVLRIRGLKREAQPAS